MKHPLPRLLAAVASAACIGSAGAATITFDDLEPSPFATGMPFLFDGDEFYQSGFWFAPFSNADEAEPGDFVGAIVDGSDVASTCFSVACPTNNATSFYASVNDGVLMFGTESGLPFTVQGVSASFLGASGVPTVTVPGLLRAQGVRADGGGSVTTTVLLPGPTAGNYAFTDFTFEEPFAQTEFALVFFYGFACDAGGSCSAFSTNRGQFAIDNLLVTAIPEPSQWALLGLGLAAIGGWQRRTRRSA